jgi:Family of unknown function (DUF6455)
MPSGRFSPSRADMRRRHRLMRRMMRIAGVKPQEAATVDGGLAILEARTKCAYCAHEDRCQAWLDGTHDFSQIKDFCSNARLLRVLRETVDKGAEPGRA